MTIQSPEKGWKASSSAGVVAGGGAEAVAAGIKILENGGNAADAAVATLFALNVTDHGACSIGGEVPLIIYDANKKEVKVLSGQGRAPLSEEAIDWYLKHGVPGDGDIKMAPVPSVVDLCLTTLQQYGTLSVEDVLDASIKLLDKGIEPWMPKLAKTFRKMVEEEQITQGSREEKIQAACDRFYGRNPNRDDIAKSLEKDYREKGGFLRISDLKAHVTTIEDPLTINYRGYTIYKCGPWTQGPYLLQVLRLLEGFDLKAMGYLSVDYIHYVIEALKLGLADRDEYYADPDFVDVPLDVLLSDDYTVLRRQMIDPQKASSDVRPGDPLNMKAVKENSVYQPGPGGTTTCVVADRWGNVVAATPSANVPKEPRDGGETGVTFSNRLRSFNTMPGHPNCIEAGKRPRITLTPTLVLKDDEPVMAISVAGGDLQDQVTLNILLNVIEFGMSADQAITSPRFSTGHHQDSFDPNPDRIKTYQGFGSITMNEGIDDKVKKDLIRRGHKVDVKDSFIGAPVMLTVDPQDRSFQAAGDPDARRHAAGLADD